MRVLHVITALGVGGAEHMLLKLLGSQALAGCEQRVLALLPGGALAARVRATGSLVRELDLLGPWALVRGLSQLAAEARRFAPDLVQGWMYHGNLGAWAAAAALPGRVPLVWGVRQSLPTLRGENAFARVAIHLNRWGSRRPDVLLFNSHTSLGQHQRQGFDVGRARVLPNGFDTDRFRPDDQARAQLRRDWGLPAGAVAFGLLARWHPVKDHAGFLQAARLLRRTHPQAHLVLAGTGVQAEQPLLAQALRDPLLAGAVHLLGERHDMPAVMAALDACVSASTAEAFSNTLGEAMASGLACVATDVGDSAAVLGGCGHVVPPSDAPALAAAMAALVDAGEAARADLGRRARERVLQHYALEAVAMRHAALYAELAGHGAAALSRG